MHLQMSEPVIAMAARLRDARPGPDLLPAGLCLTTRRMCGKKRRLASTDGCGCTRGQHTWLTQRCRTGGSFSCRYREKILLPRMESEAVLEVMLIWVS